VKLVPPKLKKQECKHEHVLRRSIGFNEAEKKGAKAKGFSLPDFIVMEICIGCWAINPNTTVKALEELLDHGGTA